MEFIAAARSRVTANEYVYDLSRNAEFASFDFIALHDTHTTLDLVAFKDAAELTET